MLVAPSEHRLAGLGESSSLPETYGADFLLFTRHGLVGIQRKRFDDLVASILDGRFQREMAQLCSSGLHQAVLVIEGDYRFGSNGLSLALKHTKWTRASLHGIELSTQLLGIWVVRTDSVEDTAAWLVQAEAWFDKAEHLSLSVRPKLQPGVWEDPIRHFWLRVLQSFDGISSKTAGAIYDKARADGVQLLGWCVEREWLLSVPGVGKGRADKLMDAFKGGTR